MKIVCLAVAAAALLSACSTPGGRPGFAFDRINQELSEAAASKPRPANADAVGKAMMPPLQLDAPAAPAPEPRFNLAVNNAPASQVFMAIVAGSKYSMVFAPDISGTVTLNLKSVTVREALDTIRELYGYEYRIQGSRIMIQSNALQSRIYQINYLASRRQGMSDTRVTSSAPSVVNPTGSSAGATGTATPTAVPGSQTPGTGGVARQSDSSRVQTISENDFWKDLGNALTTIVGGQDGRAVIVNAVSGVVLVKALPAELRSVENYLKATQLVVERQVMLEAKILEVRLSDSFQTGINWAKFAGHDQRLAAGVLSPGATLSGDSSAISGFASGTNTNGTGIASLPGHAGAIAATALGKGFFGLAFQSANFAALLSFLETQGNVQVLSSPRVATINNQKAVLKVGTDDYFVTGVSTTTTTSGTGNVVTPNITLQPFFSGISLDVTPQIDDEGNVILHVHPAVTVVEEKTKQVNLGDLGTFTLPLASSTINETDSIVRVQDGNIVAIGGLMSQEQTNNRNGLPGASRVPGLGLIFGQTGNSSSKRELVILIKPTVAAGDNWRQDVAETQERIQALDPRKIQFKSE